MNFRTLGLSLLLFSSFAFANGRSPAVEDFVGIETDHMETTPQGAESLYNLQQDIQKIETVRKDGPVTAMTPELPEAETPSGASTLFGILFAVSLPILSWMLVMNHLRQKALKESASNIEVLEKYRRQRELAKKQEEKIRKVS
jgi:hypothetical protein